MKSATQPARKLGREGSLGMSARFCELFPCGACNINLPALEHFGKVCAHGGSRADGLLQGPLRG